VRATMIITAVYISEDSAPADIPTPATITPTSPRDTIPIPTRNALVLSLRNMIEGSPHPTIFVVTAMAITVPDRYNTLKFTPRRSFLSYLNRLKYTSTLGLS
jgi:hypothetical protein